MKQTDWLRNSAWNSSHENIILIHGYAGGDGTLPIVVLKDGKFLFYVRFIIDVTPLFSFDRMHNCFSSSSKYGSSYFLSVFCLQRTSITVALTCSLWIGENCRNPLVIQPAYITCGLWPDVSPTYSPSYVPADCRSKGRRA